jgi:hypothetical protein
MLVEAKRSYVIRITRRPYKIVEHKHRDVHQHMLKPLHAVLSKQHPLKYLVDLT